MKTWEIIKYDSYYGLVKTHVQADNVYNALSTTGNLNDPSIISIRLLAEDLTNG